MFSTYLYGGIDAEITYHIMGQRRNKAAGCPFMRSMSGNFLFTISQFSFSDFHVFFAFPSHQPAATFSSRSSVSGYRRTSRTSAAA